MRRSVIAVVVCLLFGASPLYAQNNDSDESGEELFEGIDIEYDDEEPQEEVAKEPQVSEQAEESDEEERAGLKGVLLERGTRNPLAGITLYVADTPFEATTDAEGRFSLKGLPPGEIEIVVPTPQYEVFRKKITLQAGKKSTLDAYLEPRSGAEIEVVVRGDRVDNNVSEQVMEMKEATLIPGSQGDAVRVVENMPGVARGGAGFAGVVVRGSNAEDSGIFLDGHKIPMLMHFGGFKAVFNSALLDELHLYTGGFGAQYGNVTGGVVDLKSRDPREDRWGGYVDTSAIDASAMVEGPITDDLKVAFAARRSLLDLLLAAAGDMDGMSFTTSPSYADYQAKVVYTPDPKHTLRFDASGALDGLGMSIEEVDDGEPEITGDLDMEISNHNLYLRYDYEGDGVRSRFSPGVAFVSESWHLGDSLHISSDAILFDAYEDLEIDLAEWNTLGVGGRIEARTIDLDSNFIRPPKEGDVEPTFSNSDRIVTKTESEDLSVGAYLYDELRIGPVTLIPGARFDWESLLDVWAVSPSMVGRWQVVEPFTLKAGGGLYHRLPDPDEIVEPFGNLGLDYESSLQAIGGFEWQLTDVIRLDVQGYYKHLDDLVSRSTNPDSDYYENGASGYSYGGEVMLRHDWTDEFFGWVSYSLSKSMRDDGPGTPERPFDLDQRHNVVAVASWEFAKDWRLGGRFQYTSGEPYTEILGSIYNGDNGTYLPVYDEENKNAKTREPFHRLDLRLDKLWRFDTWILHTYLDVQGAYYHANPVGTIYNYDYSQEGSFRTLPITPSIGVKGEF